MSEINHIDKLPLEVLEHIMSFLDQRTRKIARQVSISWYKACRRNFKKIVISDLYANFVDRVLEMLTYSDNHIEEIEFHSVNLVDYQYSKFWERWGHRIKSLNFYETRISPEIFLNIIVNSPGLTHIGMHWSMKERHLSSFDQTMDVLDNLIRKELKNNNVLSVDTSVPYCNSAQFLKKLFSIFPNIKRLNILYWDRISRKDKLFITRQMVKWKEQLEVLSLRSYADLGVVWKSILLKADLTRLKDIHLNVSPETSVEQVTQFIGKLSNLQNLSLELSGYRIFDGSEVLLDFIFSHKSCRSLKVFKLMGPAVLIWCSEFFNLLSTSSLHTLILDCMRIQYVGSENFLINKKLKVLHLTESLPQSRELYNSHMIIFIRAFIGLEELVLAGVTAEIMNVINQYQSGLRVFRTLHEWGGGFSYGELERNVSDLVNLVDVEELNIFTNSFRFPNRFLECLRPRLRYLYVEECPWPCVRHHYVDDYLSFESVVKMLPNAPYLETLIINVNDVCFLRGQYSFSKVLRSLKYLKYLRISMPDVWEYRYGNSTLAIGVESYTKEIAPLELCNECAERMFKECPSLRTFIFLTHVYYYNVMEKRIQLKMNAFTDGAHLFNGFANFKNIFFGNEQYYVC